MSNKFDRNFRLTIQDNAEVSGYYDPNLLNNSSLRLTPASNSVINNIPLYRQGKNALVIEPPFTIEIDVNGSINLDGNTANISIYGLNESTRRRLFQNRFNIPVVEDGKKYYRIVVLEAGYKKNIYPIFNGTLINGYSVREGVDQITHLSCQSSAMGLYNSFINKSYNANTKQIEVINDIIQQMTKYGDLQKGAITPNLDATFNEAITIMGESYNVLTQFGLDVFINAGKINVLQLNEAIGKLGLQIPIISAETGLIGTPIISDEGYVIVNTMFEPTIKLANMVQLESETASFFNGKYKVMSVSHKGVLSTTKAGKLITTLKLWSGGSIVNNFNLVTQ
jgi:hypothetical protein